MKRIFAVCLLLFFASIPPVKAQDIPRPIGRVNDFADVLPASLEASIGEQLEAYKNETSIEIAVVTVPTLQGYDIESFTVKLAQKWGVGDKEKDNGLVLLLAPSEREVRIEVGYGLEGDLTDGRAGYILDNNAVPYFKNNDWAGGVSATINALIAYLGRKDYQTRLVEKAEQEKLEQARRVQAEADRARRDAEFYGALTTFFLFAVPLAVVVGGFFAFRVWYKRRKLLKKIQKDNLESISAAEAELEEMKSEFENAEKVFNGLRAVNIGSLRAGYSSMLKDLRAFIENTRSETLPRIWRDQPNHKEAQRIQEALNKLRGEISKRTEGQIAKITGLPALITAKREWVIAQRGRVISKLQDSQSRFRTIESRLDKEYGDRVRVLSGNASAGAKSINSALSIQDTDKVDWINLSSVLADIELYANRIEEQLNEYVGLVERAKSDKNKLLSSLDERVKKASEAVKHGDVEEKTITRLRSAVAGLNTIKSLDPKSDPEWVLFLNTTMLAIATFGDIAKSAVRDIEEAEEERRRARQRAEEARQAEIYARQEASRRSSESGGSSGFGGGSFGGGGASRKF